MQVSFDEITAARIVEQTRWAEQYPRSRHFSRNKPDSFGLNGWWPCINDDSTNAPGYSLAAVTNITTLPDGRPLVHAKQPSSTWYRQYVVLSDAGCTAGDYGACNFGPEVRFAYDTGAPAIGDAWGPKAGQWAASINMPGVLFPDGQVDATNNIAWGVLQLVQPRMIFGTLSSSLAAGGSATVSIGFTLQGGTPPGTVTVYDPYGSLTGGSGKVFCAVENCNDGRFYFLTVGC
jgi:hypothetical protein